MWYQKTIALKPRGRGCYLITREIEKAVPDLKNAKIGLLNVFLHHTSASLTINENVDPAVRRDLDAQLNKIAPEGEPHYMHDLEGADDMPAHIKASLLGCSVCVPISNGKLALGTWQGIYLCEHRNSGGARTVTVTVHGEGYG